MTTMQFLKVAVGSALFALPGLGQEPEPVRDPEGVEPPAPAVSLERGAYAEEHERDLTKALAHYELALAVAEAQADVRRVEAAREAIARVRQRQGEVLDTDEAEALREQMENRIGMVLRQLEGTGNSGAVRQRYRVQFAAELAAFGEVGTAVLTEMFDGEHHNVGDYSVRLWANDLASLLAAMKTREGDAAMFELMRSPNSHIRHEIVLAANSERHHDLLVAAASDPMELVRETAIRVLSNAPRPEDAALLRAALAEGLDVAASGLYMIDSKAAIVGALEPDASWGVREQVARQVLRDSKDAGGAPSLAGARLLAQVAIDPRSSGEAYRDEVAELFDYSLLLPEPDRARLEAELLSIFSERPTSEAIRLLGRVGTVPTVRALTAVALRGGIKAAPVTKALPDAVARSVREDPAALVAVLNELPLPDPDEGDSAALSLWRSVEKGLESAWWGGTAPESVLAVWQQLEPARRSLLLVAFADWLAEDDERRTHSAGGNTEAARRPGSLPAELLPVAQALVRSSDEHSIVVGMHAIQAIGELEGLLAALTFTGSSTAQRIRTAAQDAARAMLYGSDPAGARDVVVRGVLEGWRLRPEAAPLSADSLRWLPEGQVVSAFEALWPRAGEVQDLREVLFGILTNNTDAPEATVLLAQHYDEIPADKPKWRQEVLERVGRNLYEPGIELLERGLSDPDLDVRSAAFKAFQRFRGHRAQLEEFETWKRGADQRQSATEELLELLESENAAVRLGAIEALGAMKAKEALPALVRLMADADNVQQTAVRAAIARMSE